MLLTLSVKNYALIEDLTVDFSEGLTVITGETGAGKSILIKSIELLTGARADLSSIRSGCSVCTLSASFEYKSSKITDFLNNFSIPSESNIVLIRRTVENTGKSKAFINDLQVSVSLLAGLGKLLIDFHGQSEKHSLLSLDSQLEILDNEIKDIKPLLEKVSVLHTRVRDLKLKLEEMNTSAIERERKTSLYSFQIKEIEDANLKLGEDESLAAELPKLKNAEMIASLSQKVVSLLYSSDGAVLNGILKAKKDIELINSYGVDADEALSLIEQAYYQTEEAYREIKDILSKVSLDPGELYSLLERIELIKNLKKKYGTTIEAVVEYKDKISRELDSLNNYECDYEKLKKELALERECLFKICEDISGRRRKAARIFAKSVQENLFDLEMKNAVFEIKFTEKEPSANGYESVEFMFCANKGEKILPLKNTASGGELSRVLLAVEAAAKTKDDGQTIIFDEIDSGTGGKTSEKIGLKLSHIAKKKQVFCITHLAQVAAFAEKHIKVYKEIKNSRTYTKAVVLTEAEHIKEIARMISGGKLTETALEHAKNLVVFSIRV